MSEHVEQEPIERTLPEPDPPLEVDVERRESREPGSSGAAWLQAIALFLIAIALGVQATVALVPDVRIDLDSGSEEVVGTTSNQTSGGDTSADLDTLSLDIWRVGRIIGDGLNDICDVWETALHPTRGISRCFNMFTDFE